MEEDNIVWKCIYSRHGQGYRPAVRSRSRPRFQLPLRLIAKFNEIHRCESLCERRIMPSASRPATSRGSALPTFDDGSGCLAAFRRPIQAMCRWWEPVPQRPSRQTPLTLRRRLRPATSAFMPRLAIFARQFCLPPQQLQRRLPRRLRHGPCSAQRHHGQNPQVQYWRRLGPWMARQRWMSSAKTRNHNAETDNGSDILTRKYGSEDGKYKSEDASEGFGKGGM